MGMYAYILNQKNRYHIYIYNIVVAVFQTFKNKQTIYSRFFEILRFFVSKCFRFSEIFKNMFNN